MSSRSSGPPITIEAAGAAQLRQNSRAEPDRPAALHHHGVANPISASATA